MQTISSLIEEDEKELNASRYEYLSIYRNQLEDILTGAKNKGNSENISTLEEEVNYM